MLLRRVPKVYRDREPILCSWDGSDPEAVHTVLTVLADAFAWKEADAFHLRPDDKLWPIYYTYYPQDRWWQQLRGDELETETLLRDLKRVAPGRMVDLHPEVTIGDLVRLVSSAHVTPVGLAESPPF